MENPANGHSSILFAPDAGLPVTFLFFLNGALYGAWASRVPDFSHRFGLTHGELGGFLLLMGTGSIVSFPLAGHAIGRVGAPRVAVTLAAFFGLFLMLIGVSRNLVFSGLALLLCGASSGGMDVAMNAWGGAVELDFGSRIMSRLHAIWSIGASVGALSGFLALRIGLTLLPHFAGLTLLLATFGALSLRIPRADALHIDDEGPMFVLPRGGLMVTAVMAFFAMLGEGAMGDWAVVYSVDMLSINAASATIAYASFCVAMVVTRLTGDWLQSAFGDAVTLRAASIVTICGAIAVTVAPAAAFPGAQWPMALAGFILLGIGYALVMPIAFSRAAKDPNVSPGVAIAATATLGNGGLLMGPPLIGWISSITNLQIAFRVLVFGAVIIFLLALTMRNSSNVTSMRERGYESIRNSC